MTEIDFNYKTFPELNELIKGKTIERIEEDHSGMDICLIFEFTDGTHLSIRTDGIYGWELK